MDLELTLFLLAASQLSSLEPCRARPIFSYMFGDETVSAPSVDDTEPIPNESAVTTNAVTRPNDDATTTVPSSTGPITFNQEATAQTEGPVSLQPAEMTPSQPAYTPNTIAMAARLLNGGVRGAKKVVEGSTNLTTQALGGVHRLGNEIIDGVQSTIDKGAQLTLNGVSGWMDTTNAYRKGLSGTTTKPADSGHSITVTTSSNAPVKTITDFVNNYLPSGVGSGGSFPPITSIDFSKFW